MNFTRNVENACKKGYDKENKRWYSMAVASGGAGGAAAPPQMNQTIKLKPVD